MGQGVVDAQFEKIAEDRRQAFLVGAELFCKEAMMPEAINALLAHIAANKARYAGAGLGALGGGIAGGLTGEGGLGRIAGGAALGGAAGAGGGELAQMLIDRIQKGQETAAIQGAAAEPDPTADLGKEKPVPKKEGPADDMGELAATKDTGQATGGKYTGAGLGKERRGIDQG